MDDGLTGLPPNSPLIIDGAWGTQLQERGLPVGACPELWNAEHPEAVEAVARAYVDAGADIILTNTFGANRFVLDRHGAATRVTELARLGAEISRRAAGEQTRVFGSIGPSGRMLITEEVTPEELAEGFAETARALKEGGADGLVVETMSDIDEARIAVTAALATGLPVVLSMVYDGGGDGPHTMMGNRPQNVVEAMKDHDLLAIGANCGRGAGEFHAVCAALKAATDLPLWIKPNAGMPRMESGKAIYDTAPEEFLAEAVQLVEEGAAFIGGCCGTTPAFIETLSRRFK